MLFLTTASKLSNTNTYLQQTYNSVLSYARGISSCECTKVVTDNLGKIEISVDKTNTGKNTQLKIYNLGKIELSVGNKNKAKTHNLRLSLSSKSK